MECRLHIVRRNKAPMDFELSSIDINIQRREERDEGKRGERGEEERNRVLTRGEHLGVRECVLI